MGVGIQNWVDGWFQFQRQQSDVNYCDIWAVCFEQFFASYTDRMFRAVFHVTCRPYIFILHLVTMVGAVQFIQLGFQQTAAFHA